MTNVAPSFVKPRTGWAIAVALIAYVIFYAIYGFLMLGLLELGVKYDQSNTWAIAGLISMFVVPGLAGYAGVIIALHFFRAVNRETLIYAFGTGVILVAIFGSTLHPAFLRDLIQAVIALLGGWIATHPEGALE